MILIGIINVIIGYCSYTPPSDLHERIIPDVPYARARGAVPRAAVTCAGAIAARVGVLLPGATIIDCTPDRVTVARDDQTIEVDRAGDDIVAIAETLTLPQIPAPVMRAFAIAYPRTIPAGAIKRTRRGEQPIYELAFPPGRDHTVATLRGDGTVIDLR